MRVTERTALALSTAALVLSTVTLVVVVSHVSRPHDDAEEPSGPPALAGTTWLLESLGTTGNVRPALSNVEVTLEFSNDGRISGNAGCNGYFGQYVVNADHTLSVSGLGSTKMFCHEPGVMQQEQDFLAALGQAQHYRVVNGRLTITGENTELALVLV